MDPDFGWHLRYGQIILSSGIPFSDPFSYTMPSYNYANHEWLSDIFLAKAYSVIGLSGLSLIFSILAVASLLYLVPKNYEKYIFIPLLLSSTILTYFVGIRPQIITWFLTAVLLKILLNVKLYQKFRLFLPLFFLFWANLHGGFVAGLAIYLIIILIRFWQEKKAPAFDLFILIISFVATLINPYGIRLWEEIGNTATDTQLRWNILEWTPIISSINIPFILFFSISSVLIIKQRQTIDLIMLVLFLVFSVLTFSSARYAPLWILIALPQTAICFKKIFDQIKNKKHALVRFGYLTKFLLYFSLFFLSISLFSNYSRYKNINEDMTYPAQAINFLINHQVEGEVFAPYDWGGFLIWKYPEKKVFIDGRMPSWRWNPPNQNESDNAFKEYQEVVYENRDYQTTFDKYNIKVVLWHAEKQIQLNSFQKIYSNISAVLNNLVFKDRERAQKSLNTRLEEAGWKKIYLDEAAVIYAK